MFCFRFGICDTQSVDYGDALEVSTDLPLDIIYGSPDHFPLDLYSFGAS